MVFKFETFIGFISLAGFCLAIGGYLDKGPNIINENMKTILKQGKNYKIKDFCQIFVKSFDFIYIKSFRYPLVSYLLWIWIFLSWGFILYLYVFAYLGSKYIEPYFGNYIGICDILLASLILSSVTFTFLMFFIKNFHKNIPRYNYLFDVLVLIGKGDNKLTDYVSRENEIPYIPVLSHFYNLILLIRNIKDIVKNSFENYQVRSSLLKGLFISTCIATGAGVSILIMGMFTRIVVELISTVVFPTMQPFYIEYSVFLNILFELCDIGYSKFFVIMCELSIFVFFNVLILSIYTYSFLCIMDKYKLVRFSPVSVILSSIFAVFIFSMFELDLIIPFIINQQLIDDFVPLVFLNIITDSLSIVETRYMLSKAVTGSSAKLILYLILDFLASSLLYLIIPILTGVAVPALNGIFFKGDADYFGIFYWSSLSTSLFLYLYIISFLILTISYKISSIEYLAERPSYSLGWIAGITLVIVYPLYVWLKIVISYIIPATVLILLVLLTSNLIKKANAE